MNKKEEFGTFDLDRELTDYELKHFDEFMKITNSGEDVSNVDLGAAYEEIKDYLFSDTNE